MNSKTKTFFALTVKLVFALGCVQAQIIKDSVKQNSFHFAPAYNNFLIVKQTLIPAKLPGNFYTKQLPFFCSKELQIQKITGIPIKFRLSTVEYCDKLEGKNK